jgi:CO dehydrogenase nickel-insertion accessory protein CooC1
MKQLNAVKFISEDGKMMVVCDADTNVGLLHDFLLEIKGNVVEKIIAAQKQEREAAEKVKEADAKKAEEVKPEVVEAEVK